MKQNSKIKPPIHIVWSADEIDLSDPFQRKWYIKQILTHGRAEDIRSLDLDEVSQILDELNLPKHIYELWKDFLKDRNA